MQNHYQNQFKLLLTPTLLFGKLLVIVLLFLGGVNLSKAQTISTSAITGSPFCAGVSVSVPYTITGTFNAGNIFTAQLSDASGVFTSPTSIGTLASVNNGTISAIIPPATPTGSSYRIRVIGNNPSITGAANGVNLTINAAVTPSVSLALTTGTNPSCAGSSLTFTATPTNGGAAPNYNFRIAGSSIQSGASATFTTSAVTNGQLVDVIITSNATCASPTTATSAGITINRTANVTPSVGIALTSGTNPSCAGSSLTFTATPTNGGAAPSYNFRIAGSSIQSGASATFTTSTVNNGQVVDVIITSNATCASPTTATSAGITMTVNPVVVPSVSISITTGTNPTCSGTSITFTAAPTNGGAAPNYQWTRNGTNIGGATSVAYSAIAGTAFITGDLIRCVLTSNAVCRSTNTATSAPIAIGVTANTTPSVSIAITTGANPICNGQSVTFTATPNNAGGSPTYQWTRNSVNIGSATLSTYTGTAGTAFTNGQTIACIVTSNGVCPLPATVTSSGIVMSVNPLPTVISVVNGSVCGSGQVNISATPSAGATIDWYAAAITGSVLSGGSGTNTFTTPLINAQATIPYYAEARNTTTGCISLSRTTVNATANAFPNVAAITGNQSTCIGSTTNFANTTGGGVWSTSNALIASVSGTGVVTGVAIGTTNINYTITGAGGCQTIVSRTVTVYNGPQGTPDTYGNGFWNAYVYNATDYTTNYAGFYTTPSALSYNTTTQFANNAAPSSVATYQGCQVGNTNYSVRFQRTGFTTDTYQIGVTLNDDNMNIIIDGVTIYGVGYSATVRTNVWTGTLTPTSQVEIRYLNNSGPGEINFSINQVSTTPANSGTISGNQSSCNTVTPITVLGNVSVPTQGTCSLLPTPIQWESSIDNVLFNSIVGANATAYTIPTPLSQTTYYRRAYRTYCDTVYSNVVTVTIYNGAQGTPNVFGNGLWNAYVYNATDYVSNYSGYFTTPAALSFNTVSLFGNNAAPSTAATYQGCPIGNTNYSIRFQRTGFATNIYQIGLNINDDNMNLIIDGVTVYSSGYSATVRPNVWTGILTPSSQVEIRYLNNSGPGEINFTFTTVVNTPPSAGTINGTQSTCNTVAPSVPLNNVIAPSAGTCSLVPQPVQWQLSTDNINFANITGANANAYTIPSLLSQTTYYRRVYRTFCDTVFSNTVTVTVYNGAQGTPNTYGNGLWNAYVYNATDFSTNYSGFYTTGSALSYNTLSDYANNAAPSLASTYQGCPIGNTNYSIRYQRTGFTPGTYRIGVNLNDDNMNIIINGLTVYSSGYSTTVRTNVWTGNLNAGSLVEIRYLNNSGPGEINFTLNSIVNSPSAGGTIAGNQSTCNTVIPFTPLTNVLAATAGSCNPIATPIQWQSSTDNILFSNILGANANGYTIPSLLSQTTYYRRAYFTFCDTAYSNTLTVTVYNGAQGTPNTYSNGFWNAFVYNSTDFSSNYSGFYTTVNTLSYNTVTDYAAAAAPSTATTYQGCPVGNTNYSVRFQQTGFATNVYRIGVNRNDDNMNIIIDGVTVYSFLGSSGTIRPNVWTGTLTPTSQVEIRYLNFNGPGDLNFTFSTIANTPGNAGTIAGNQSTCNTIIPSVQLTNVSVPTAGTCTLLPIAVQWQSSTNNINFTDIAGANANAYTIPSVLTQTTYYRRAYSSYCDTLYSNTITVTVFNGVQGTPNTYGNGFWNAFVYNSTDFSSNYSGFYTTANTLSYNTVTDYAAATAPSIATTYQGCPVGNTNYSVRFQQTGFASNVYRIGVNRNDDNMNIIIDGVTVYSFLGSSGTIRPNVWTGTLTPISQVEIRYLNFNGPGDLNFTFTTLTNVGTNAGNINGNQTICSGNSASTLGNTSSPAVTTCTAVLTNPIQWQSSTDNITFANISGANATTYAITPALTQTTYFRRTYRTYCDTVFTNTVTVNVNPRPVMTSSNAVSICSGSAVGLALTASVPSTFVWVAANQPNVGGESTTNQTGATITNALTNVTGINQLVNYTVIPTSTSGSCAALSSQTVVVTVQPFLTPSVAIAITTGSNPVCNGSSVTFTATPTNGGITPGYQWTRNGVNISSATSSTYNALAGTDFTNGQLIRCVLTSSANCLTSATATSSAIVMNVTSSVTPLVNLAVTSGNSNTCTGANVTFTATPTNGGAGPLYNFRVNGNSVQNSASNTYSSNTLLNGQVVDVIMNSNTVCPLPASVQSNQISMIVNIPVTATISISSSQSNLCTVGVSFSSSITNGGASPGYQWKRNGVNIFGANSSTYASTSLVNGDVITCELTSTAACVSPTVAASNSITITLTGATTTWIGLTSDWSIGFPINWSNGYPSSNTTAIIPAGTPNNPQVNDIVECFNIVIQSGASLTINGVNQLNVYGKFTNDGVFNANFGSVEFLSCTGSSVQAHEITSTNATTTSFFNVRLDDLAGLNLTSNARISGALTLTNGTFNNSANVFTFISTATGTARIAPVAATANYAGNITMQRFAPGPKTGWAQLGTPIQGATLAQWYDNFPMQGFTGVFGGGFTGFVSVYTYNEPTPGVFDATGSYVGATNVTNNVPVGKGFWVYLGNAGPGGTSTANTLPITIDVTGQPTVGNFNFNPTYTNSSNPFDDGYNLIANPYPSAIDWLSPNWTKTNINNAIYMYQADNGQYASFVGGIATNGGSRFIASSQGFYIQTNAASPVLNITENAKSASNPVLIKESDPSNVLRIKVEGDSLNDEMVIHLNENATENFDGSFDAKKMFSNDPSNPSISSINNNKDLSINSLPFSGVSMSIPVRVNVGSNGMYHLNWTGIEGFEAGSCFVIEDLDNGTKTVMEKDAVYYFTANVGFKAPRFLIHISTPLPSKTAAASCSNSQDGSITLTNPSVAASTVTLKDASGSIIKVATVISSYTFEHLAAGMYQVAYPNATACGAMNQMINVPSSKAINANFEASASEVFTNEAVNFSTAITKDSYITWDFGDGATAQGTTASHNYQTEGTFTVSMTNVRGECSETESKVLSVKAGGAISNVSMDVQMQNGIFYAVFYFNENSTATISIVNALGQEVTSTQQYEGKSGKVRLQLDNAAEGVYLVTLRNGSEILTKKIVK